MNKDKSTSARQRYQEHSLKKMRAGQNLRIPIWSCFYRGYIPWVSFWGFGEGGQRFWPEGGGAPTLVVFRPQRGAPPHSSGFPTPEGGAPPLSACKKNYAPPSAAQGKNLPLIVFPANFAQSQKKIENPRCFFFAFIFSPPLPPTTTRCFIGNPKAAR